MKRLLEVVSRLQELITSPPDPSATRNRGARLLALLDELAFRISEIPEGEPSDNDVKPPRADYSTWRGRISAQWPRLGFYSTIPYDDFDGPLHVGDAIDDLADIVIELEEIRLRYSMYGPADAALHTHLLYRTHFGYHLVDLRRVLFNQLLDNL